uniref:Glycosyl hydrolase family 65 protein n=1 Tax=Roseihalotalea indica TaxID=2867963 RepID=A0AA49JFK8_9BACT|nr:glycosyl hydrolase family 65 protein [Tunicatimonas sp. TK19036]
MNNWKLVYKGLNTAQEGLREALCTLGNGYFATRGAAEESVADQVHYPGTYLAGGYNRLPSMIAGKFIENEDLVNWPNWLSLSFKVEGDENWFSLERSRVIHYRQELDMALGILRREMHFIDPKNRESTIVSTRLASMDNPHWAAIRWEFQAVNWSGSICLRTGLDGSVKNEGVKRYGELNNQHLKIIDQGETTGDVIYLLVQSNQSRIYMAQATCCQVFEEDRQAIAKRKTTQEEGKISQYITLDVRQKKVTTIEKTVVVFTSKDQAISEPLIEARQAIAEKVSFTMLEKNHAEAWARLWKRFDISFLAPENSQLLLRLHIFHLLQTCSMHTIGRDVGVPARGWHGEAYRGHIFWDELFIFPLLNFRMPDLTRSLLLYRYNRLHAARKLAEKEGLRGAMFPWQSSSNGREESQVVHLNPQSGQWVPDHTYLQRHVNLAIAYNIWQYYEATADMGFMKFYGVEMLLEIARFFTSISTWNESKGRYEILKVVGPDEFHTAYPRAEQPGIDNNAYTNFMASWLFSHTLMGLALLGESRKNELIQKLEIEEKELQSWDEISRKLFIPFIENGIIAQFEGYDKLKDFDWEGYRKKYDNIQRLDRILDAEGDSVNRYKASKQADVLMLFYLFSSEELGTQLERLGYDFAPTQIPENILYYLSRTSNGSTLSRIVQSWVEVRADRECAWHCFREALVSDFEDVQGGTTAEGIHLGSMAGTVDIMQRCLTGLEIRDDVLWLNPHFPKEIASLKMQLYYRGVWLMLDFSQHKCRVEAKDGNSPPVTIRFPAQELQLQPGKTEIIDI